MDTSEQYIKMCGCGARQEQNPHKDFLDGYKHSTVNGIAIITGTWFFTSDNWANAIWLPRQDQLQEMLVGLLEERLDDDRLRCVDDTALSLLRCFAGELATDGLHLDDWKEYYFQFSSMEQLWLAFVLKEKFNKTWDGDKWVGA